MDKDNNPQRKFEPTERRRPRRLAEASSAEVGFPLVWIVIGGLAGLIVIGLIGLGVVNLVRQGAITPTPQVLPPLVEPVETPAVATATPLVVEATTPLTATTAGEQGAETPAPTSGAVQEPAPGKLVVGGYAKVIGTDGAGLSMRAGPGRNNARIGLAGESDDVVLKILDGPREDESAEDYVWWLVQHPDGTQGWVVQDFLAPVPAP